MGITGIQIPLLRPCTALCSHPYPGELQTRRLLTSPQPHQDEEGPPTCWQSIKSCGAPSSCWDHALHPLGFSGVVEAEEGRLAQADGAPWGERGFSTGVGGARLESRSLPAIPTAGCIPHSWGHAQSRAGSTPVPPPAADKTAPVRCRKMPLLGPNPEPSQGRLPIRHQGGMQGREPGCASPREQQQRLQMVPAERRRLRRCVSLPARLHAGGPAGQ